MAAPFSIFTRQQHCQNLSREHFDVVVIGGGITGAGIALDAVQRGLKTLLLEKDDFASGTSSRSTKLIHGGLRYLKQLEIGLVREVGTERAIVHRMAPHMVIPEKMLLPLVQDGSFGKWATSLGLWVYDVLAGVDDEDARIMLNREQTLEKEPLLNPDKLIGGGYYAEYRTDDARLTIENIKKAAELGAIALNYVCVEGFIYKQNKVAGVAVLDRLNNIKAEVQANYVINATGPWVDLLRKKDNSLKGKRLHLTKGIHLVVDHSRLPVRQAVYFDVPDGRMIFAIPRGNITYIGTTDTDYKGNIEEVAATAADADYLLNAVNNVFPSVNLKPEDILSSWAGLRPLIHEDGKSASELSRKDEIFESETGLYSIAGGKLTGYRKMAERIVDKVMDRLEEEKKKAFVSCATNELRLPGGGFRNYQEVVDYTALISDRLVAKGISRQMARYLVQTYGKQTEVILGYLGGSQASEADLLMAELNFAFEFEMACSPADFFIQRTGRLYFDIHSVLPNLERVLDFFAQKLNWETSMGEQERLRMLHYVERATACARW